MGNSGQRGMWRMTCQGTQGQNFANGKRQSQLAFTLGFIAAQKSIFFDGKINDSYLSICMLRIIIYDFNAYLILFWLLRHFLGP